jgi:hypothetical protein
MTTPTRSTAKRARRSKSLEVDRLDDSRIRFMLALEDTHYSEDGTEVIHALEIAGELSVPDLEILAIEPRATFQPFVECAASLEPVRQMVGTRIGPGFRSRVLEVMGRERGCTHFLTLTLDLAAAHTLSTFLRMREQVPYAARDRSDGEWMRAGLELEPRLENACIALRSSSPVIQNAKDKQ